MKVKCIANNGNYLDETLIDKATAYKRDSGFQLIIGKEYTVYAISYIKSYPWFLICDEASHGRNGELYPQFLPSVLFVISDNRISKYWRLAIATDPYDLKPSVSMGFEELISDEFFLGNLWEDRQKERSIFTKYKLSMDNEFI